MKTNSRAVDGDTNCLLVSHGEDCIKSFAMYELTVRGKVLCVARKPHSVGLSFVQTLTYST